MTEYTDIFPANSAKSNRLELQNRTRVAYSTVAKAQTLAVCFSGDNATNMIVSEREYLWFEPSQHQPVSLMLPKISRSFHHKTDVH